MLLGGGCDPVGGRRLVPGCAASLAGGVPLGVVGRFSVVFPLAGDGASAGVFVVGSVTPGVTVAGSLDVD